MSGLGSAPGTTSLDPAQLTVGTLDVARAGDLTTLFTLATLSAELYWQEDVQGRCTGISLNASAATDFARQLSERALDDLLVPPTQTSGDDLLSGWKVYQAARQARKPFRQLALSVRLENTEICYLLVSGTPQYDAQENFIGYHCLARDVTHERTAEQRQQRFREAIDMSSDMIYLVDRATLRFLDINTTASTLTGFSREELMSMHPADAMGFSVEELTKRYDHLIRTGNSSQIERRTRTRDGQLMIIEVHSRAININDQWIIIGISRDVTTRKQAELRVLRLQQMFSTLSRMNEAILRSDNIPALYSDVCNTAAACELFSLATIHSPRDGFNFDLVASAGQTITDSYPRPVIDAALPEGRGPVATAFRSQKTVWTYDYQNDERTGPWHETGREYGIASSASLPLMQRKQCVAVMTFYGTRRGLFDQEILAILQSMVENINFRLDGFASDEEQARAAAVIRENEERFRSLTTLSSDFYWELDKDLCFVKYEGRALGESNVQAVKEVLGRRLWDMPGVTLDSMDWNSFRRLLKQEKTFKDFEFSFVNEEGQQYHYAFSGEPILDDDNRFVGYRGISRDITEKKHIANHIEYLATHDTLTGLPNRVMFQQLLHQATLNAKRYKDQAFAMLFLDLDEFKEINDTYGHHVGDLLLAEVAQRLRAPLRKSDVVARLGGDEFVIILQRVSDPDRATQIAQNVLRSLGEPITINSLKLHVSGSMGISLFGVDSTEEDTLMNHADTAMYAAKENGPNQVRVYSPSMQKLSESRANLSVLLHQALERDELTIHYQAKVSVATGEPLGLEALMRWMHPELGEVPPSVFIPVAEENGLIPCLGKWALRIACEQMMSWRKQGIAENLTLAVNLSARQFCDPDLVERVKETLDDTGFPAEQLELELTESLMARSPERAVALMTAIKELGVRFALDDFGTGYSSLGLLLRFPLDTLKMDQTFIQDLVNNEKSRIISRSVIDMARSLGLVVVAEGVETQEQLEILREFGCDQAQGSLFSKALPADDIVQWYRASTQQQ